MMPQPDDDPRPEEEATPLAEAGRLSAGSAETTLIRGRGAPPSSGDAEAEQAEQTERPRVSRTTTMRQRMRTAGIKVELDLGLWSKGDSSTDGDDEGDLEDTHVVLGGLKSPDERWLDHYRVIETIGRGAMGVVYLVEDDDLGRLVAAKALPKDEQTDEARIRRFLLEARVSGQLEHPAIVPVYHLGLDPDGQIYYTMRRVKGSDLGTRIAAAREQIATSMDRAGDYRRYLRRNLDILLRVCDAVSYAHHQGVIHRDLRPSNLMVGRHGQVIVMDWGLAKILGDKDVAAPGITLVREEEARGGALVALDGTAVATPAYMAPELARGNVHEVDQRGDVYALGAILHEILCFERPFAGDDAVETLHKVLAGTRQPAPEGRPGLPIPAALEAVVAKATAFEASRRYRTVESMREDIDRYLVGGDLAIDRPTGIRGHVDRHPRVAAAALAGALVLLLAVVAAIRTGSALDAERQARLGAEDDRRQALAERDARAAALSETTRARDAARVQIDQATRAGERARRDVAGALVGRACEAIRADRPREAAALLHAARAAPRRRAAAARLALPPVLVQRSARAVSDRALTALAVSTDGQWLAIGDAGGGLQVRRRDTLALRWSVGTHIGAVRQLAFSRDGRWLVSAGRDRLRRWDWQAGKGEAIGESAPFAVAGQHLAVAVEETVVMGPLGDGDDGRRVLRMTADVAALAASPDGARVLAVDDDGALREWEVASGKQTAAIALGDTAIATGATYTRDGRFAVAGGSELRVSDARRAGFGRAHEVDMTFQQGALAALEAGGRHLLVTTCVRGLLVHDAADGAPLGAYGVHGWRARSACVLGDRLLVGTREGTLVEMNVQYDRRHWRLEMFDEEEDYVDSEVSPDGRLFVSTSRQITILWAEGGAPKTLFEGERDILAFAPSGEALATVSESQLTLWDAAGKRLARLDADVSDVLVLGRDLLVLEGSDGIAVWRGSGTPKALAGAPAGGLLGAVPGGKFVVWRDERALELWDARAGKRLWQRDFRQEVAEMAASPDGRWLAVGEEDGRIALVDLADPLAAPRVLRGHAATPQRLAWSPDSATLASQAGDHVRLWDARSGKALTPEVALPVDALAFGRRGLVHTDGVWLVRRGIDLAAVAGVRLDGTRLVAGDATPAPR